MLDKIVMILQDECSLEPKKLSVIGVSGGADSVCLLHMLNQLGYYLLAVHVNHKLRLEADEEEKIVGLFINRLGVEFASFQVDVQSYIDEHSVSVEEAARVMRYQVLFDQADKRGAQAVLVAHNADDQVETVLMHFLRGSGLTGLRGMEYRTLPNAWSATIPLVRPMITTWREEVLGYLNQQDISYTTDNSNYDTTFFRNQLRHELLPHLKQYNPRIRENLLRMSQVNKEDYAVIQELVMQAWQKNIVKQGAGYVAFKLAEFQELGPSIQRYILRRAIAYHLPSLRDIDFDCIQRGINFLCDDTRHGQSDLMAGLRLLKEGELFWLTTWAADLPASEFPMVPMGEELPLEIPSILPLNHGCKFKADIELEVDQAVQKSQENCDPFQAWFDLDQVDLPLLVRNRKPGERFQPLGMNGHSLKVSDLMVNLKMPKRTRSTWPMVCAGDSIVWIPGYRQSHLARITLDTHRIAHLKLSKSSGT